MFKKLCTNMRNSCTTELITFLIIFFAKRGQPNLDLRCVWNIDE